MPWWSPYHDPSNKIGSLALLVCCCETSRGHMISINSCIYASNHKALQPHVRIWQANIGPELVLQTKCKFGFLATSSQDAHLPTLDAHPVHSSRIVVPSIWRRAQQRTLIGALLAKL